MKTGNFTISRALSLSVFILGVFFIAPRSAQAIRMFSSGFETNTLTDAIEWDTISDLASIDTSIYRSGESSMRINVTVDSGTANHVVTAMGAGSTYSVRTYMYIASAPSADTYILAYEFNNVGIKLTNGRQLKLFGAAQLGSNSATLDLNTWYRIEMVMDYDSDTVTGYLDGVQFATGTGLIAGSNVHVGIGTGSITADLYFDDFAINDDTGTEQTGLPGEGKIIMLNPNAAGDANSWQKSGGGSGTTTNYQDVDENPPDDATSYLQSTTLNDEDFYNVTNAGLGSGDTITLVSLGVRYAASSASNNPTFKVEARKTTGGTISQGSAITPNSTSYTTNANATPKLPTLTLYDDPDASPWTNTTIDSMQIGIKVTTDNTNTLRVSNVWALVEYVAGTQAQLVVQSPFASRSTTFIVDPPSFHSISGLSTSATFRNLFAGGQVANGFSTSTNFKVCAGQLCTLADFGGPNPAGIPYLSAYRWFANADSAATGAPLADLNTATSAPAQGTPFRLRATLHVPVIDLDPADPNVLDFKLQFAQMSGSCDTAWAGETYADVATGSGVIRYAGNGSVANGAAITASSSDPIHGGDTVVAQTYQEQNNFTATSTITVGNDGLWDFVLVDNSAPGSTTYCFRVVDTNNASATPERVPEITTFGGGATISVAGTVYSDDGLTTTTSSVSISVNGGTKTTVSTNGSGAYNFASVSQPTAGDVITVWMDNDGGGNGTGATVTLYNTGNITDLHIYKSQLITRHENSGPLANTDIDACTKTLGAGCADSDLHFDVSGGNLTVDNDWGLYLWGGDTFTPGGAVTLSNTAVSSAKGGDIKWASSTSVISMGNNALSVGSDWNNAAAGSFTTGQTQTTTFTATGTGHFINTGGISFRRVTFDGVGGSWSATTSQMTVGSAAVTEQNLTMTNGTLDNSVGTSSIQVTNGNAVGAGGVINLTDATFTMMLVGTTTANFGQTSGSDWVFKDLVFTNASTTATTFQFTTLTSGSGNIDISDNLQVLSSPTAGNTMALNAGNRTWTLSGDDGIPFHLSATGGSVSFDSSSSTFVYSGSNAGGNTTIASTTYWNLSVGSGSGETYVFGADTTMNNNLSMSGFTDTLDTTGRTTVVNGGLAHVAGTISGTGDITVKGAMQFGANATVSLTGGTFEHLIGATTTIQIQTPLSTAITFNNFKMNNSAADVRTATLQMTSPSSGFSVSNDWTIGDNSSSTYIFSMGGGITTLLVDVNNDTTFSTNATVRAATSTIRTARNLTVTGTLTPASSTFQFDTTTTSTISGGTSLPLYFNNFTATTANKPLVFATSTPYFEIGGVLTLTGTAGNEVTLDSNASGTQWLINHQGTESVEYVSLKDSGCIATSTDITITSFNAIDRGNNDNTPCWLITPTIAVSGTVYSDEGVTTATSTVTLALGGSTSYTTSTNGSGVYTFPTIPMPATSSVMTVWLDNGTSTKAGATVTRYVGSGDLTDLHIYQNRLITRHEDAGPLTVANIGICDKTTGSACADSDLHFDEAGVDSTLTVDNDWALYLWGGDTFTPTAAVTLSAGGTAANPGGDLKWASSTSVLDIAGYPLSVGGDWWNAIGGTFTKWTTSTATFIATQTGMRIDSGAQAFANMTFNGSGGTWSATNTVATVNGSITMTAGTVDNSAGSTAWDVYEGNVTGTSGVFNLTTSTFTMNQNGGNGTLNFGGTSANWTFNNLVMQNTATTSLSSFLYVSPDTVTTTVSNVYTIGHSNPIVLISMVRFASSNVELAGTTGIPLVYRNQGNVQYESSTIAYTGNNGGGNTTVLCREPYWNLVLNNASETYAANQACNVTNDTVVNAGNFDFSAYSMTNYDDFIINSSGTVAPGSAVILIGGDFSNTGTFTSGSSTVSLSLSTATSTINGTTTFWDFQVSGVDKPALFGANQTFTINNQLSLSGSPGQHLKIDSTASGTQWFINHQGTETVSDVSLKDSGCDAGSTYITLDAINSIDRGNNGFCWLFPSLSFTISPLSVSMALNDVNTFTDTDTNTLTVSTNGEFGYNVTAYADSLMTRIGSATTIANWTGTNAVPTTWTTTCIGSGTCGFGYSTDDADLTQFSSTKFAGFTTSTPGEVVATDTGRVTGDATVMTYRTSVNLSQAAGDYQTTIRYIVTPAF